MIGVLCTLLGSSGVDVARAADAPPASTLSVLFDPTKARYLRRDRRSRTTYRIATATGVVGFTVELVGLFVGEQTLIRVGGTTEALAAPVMAIASLRSANALGRFYEAPFPAWGTLAMGAWVTDLATYAVAVPALTTRRQRLRAAGVATGSRLSTYLFAILQHRANQRNRRRLGLRATSPSPPRRGSLVVSPWFDDRTWGLTVVWNTERK